MNCPKCGAKGTDRRRFACGSYLFTFEDMVDDLQQSELCKDIEHDKKHIAFMHKWREVVLSKTEATLGGVYSMMTKTPGKFGTVAEMFDSAVRKEME